VQLHGAAGDMAQHGRATFYAKSALGVAAIVAAVYLLDWRAIRQAADQLSLVGLLFVLAIILVEFPVLAWRWHLLVGRTGGASARRHVEMYLIGGLLALFTPGQLGGDAYRLVLLRQESIRTRLGLTLLLRERLLGLSSYLLFLSTSAAIALWTSIGISAEGTWFLLLCAAMAGGGAFALCTGSYVMHLLRRISLRRTRRFMRNTLKLVHRAFQFRSSSEAARLLGISLVGPAIWVIAYDVVARFIDIKIGFFLLATVVLSVELIRLVPVTVQGLGVREASFAAIFALLGQDAAAGFVICAVCYLLLNVATLIGGLTGYGLAFADQRVIRAKAKSAEQARFDSSISSGRRRSPSAEPI
jgi:glycosyltransferase 2 family protein